MARFTISVPKEWKNEMDEMPHVNWPEVAKSAVLKKLSQLQKFDRILKKGDL
jgi:hypothetical protein